MTRARTAIVLALLVVLAGCSGAGGEQLSGGDGLRATGGEATGDPLAATEADASGAGDTRAYRQNRELIRTAEARVEVESFDAASDRLRSVVRANGGFVGDTVRQRRGEGNRTWTEGRLVLRVPAENYSAVIEAVNETGEVVSFRQQTRDVTDQVVDLEARLANLRAERDQLRELFDDANETEDVLAVQERLADVQAEIERAEAQLRQLERQVALATVTVQLEEEPPEAEEPEESAWFDTPLTAAFAESVEGVVTTLRAATVLFAFALPYLVVFGVPIVGVAAGIRRYRSSGEPAPPDETSDPPDEPSDSADRDAGEND